MSTPPPAPQGPQDNPFRAPEPGQGPGVFPGQVPPVWGRGYAPPYRPVPQVNGVAIAALVLGLLCFLPAVGLVLGIIALVQIKRRGERGRAMAIGGTVLSSLGLALWVLAIGTNAGSETWQAIKDAADTTSVTALDKGDCFDLPHGDTIGSDVSRVDEADCLGTHDAEIFGVVPVSGEDFPGRAELRDIGNDKCYALKARYSMDPWALPADVDWYTLLPLRAAWENGDREITCVYAHTGFGTLTGSLRRDETVLDADQFAYLKAMNAVDDVLYAEPEEYPDENLDINKAWAGLVRDELARQTTALENHAWSAGARPSVDGLVKDLHDAREAWRKAAGADDVDSYYLDYNTGYEFVDGDATVDARRTLGLATTPPSYEEGEGSSEGDGQGELDV
ncbi:DUF4190 domain-containing protein [Streptomyces roseirectus]|uniref:DUF4190 domain-containing protein n=1 Tax=Streptomyces roseirectus TaxID=2768066 RepID=UPI001FE83E7B|nr:DUF4190 domain-containing protein [Streptomyces roseirectus]